MRLALVLLCSLRGAALYLPRAPFRTGVSPTMMASKAMPEKLLEFGADDALWSRMRNKKGILDLLKKGRDQDLLDRIAKVRQMVEDEDREVLETKLLILRTEGDLAIARRADMLKAYAATTVGAKGVSRVAAAGAATRVNVVDGVQLPPAPPAAPPAPSPPTQSTSTTASDESETTADLDERIASLREREVAEAVELQRLRVEKLRSDGELAVRRREATLAAQSLYANATAAAPLPSAETALVEAALSETAETIESAARRAYQASPISAFVPPPPPPPIVISEEAEIAAAAAAPAIAARIAELDDLKELGFVSGVEYERIRAGIITEAAAEGMEAVVAEQDDDAPVVVPSVPVVDVDNPLAFQGKPVEEKGADAEGGRLLARLNELERALKESSSSKEDYFDEEKDENAWDLDGLRSDVQTRVEKLGAAVETVKPLAPAAGVAATAADAVAVAVATPVPVSPTLVDETGGVAESEAEEEEAPGDDVAKGSAKSAIVPPSYPDRRAGGVLVPRGESSLAPALARGLDLLDLYDPTTLAPEEQDKAVGAVATGTALVFPVLLTKFGLLPDLAFSLAFGGGVSGYCALRKDVVGRVARDVVGASANLALFTAAQRAQEIEDEYEVTRQAQERLGKQLEQLVELRDRVGGSK